MSDRVWAIILAAGGSVRFGGPKAMALWGEETLLDRAVRTASAVCGQRVLVVTGGHAAVITPAITVRSAFNPDWKSGLGSSICTGTQAVLKEDPDIGALLLLPVDQPFVTSGHLKKLSASALNEQVCTLTSDGKTIGPPAAVPAILFKLLLQIEGDKGLKFILNNEKILTVDVPGILRDVDTPEDAARYQETGKH